MTLKPYTRLGYAVIQQAVEDLKELRKKGYIVGMQPVDPWPTDKNKLGHSINIRCCGYSRPHEIKELILWLQGAGLDDYLELIDSKIDASAIQRELFGQYETQKRV